MVFLDGGVGHCGSWKCQSTYQAMASHHVLLPRSSTVELTVDAGDDMDRIEVRDDDASLPGSGRGVSLELREASTAV